jgi:hypothetical protein
MSRRRRFVVAATAAPVKVGDLKGGAALGQDRQVQG